MYPEINTMKSFTHGKTDSTWGRVPDPEAKDPEDLGTLNSGKNSVRFPGLGTVWESSYIQKKLGRISETVIHVALKSPTFSHNICISHIRPSTDPDVVTDHR